jgi:hypothetical protein
VQLQKNKKCGSKWINKNKRKFQKKFGITKELLFALEKNLTKF